MKINQYPRSIVKYIYYFVYNMNLTPKTMSVYIDYIYRIPDITGGSQLLNPLHNTYAEYMSLEEYASILSKGITMSYDEALHWNGKNNEK